MDCDGITWKCAGLAGIYLLLLQHPQTAGGFGAKLPSAKITSPKQRCIVCCEVVCCLRLLHSWSIKDSCVCVV